MIHKRDNIKEQLKKLSKSKFRNSFILREKDIKYLKEKGYVEIRHHAYEFVLKRIAPQDIINDGKQTPMKGHPVFIAQHATATCCRKCLFKWHKIPEGKDLNNDEILYIVEIIMEWLTINLLNKDR